jgi:septal ring factor EnvC (AmiA/AmiB activator)
MMFGHDEPEALQDEIRRLKTTHDAREQDLCDRIDHLTGALGDLFLLVEAGAPKFDWEDSQTEYYARGLEATLMVQAKKTRDVCSSACKMIQKDLAALGLNPQQVGVLARAKHQADERRARAAALRAEAARLEAEV